MPLPVRLIAGETPALGSYRFGQRWRPAALNACFGSLTGKHCRSGLCRREVTTHDRLSIGQTSLSGLPFRVRRPPWTGANRNQSKLENAIWSGPALG